MPRALLIDAAPELRDALAATPLLSDVEVEFATGEADALRRLRRRGYGAVVSSAATSLCEDLPLAEEMRSVRPGVRVILLAPSATPEEVIAALRQRVFACFSAPFDTGELIHMLRQAIDAEAWRDGIELVSVRPDWLSARVDCRLLTAERLLRFMSELRSDLAASDRESLLDGFREILLNAMEHGTGFDPEQIVEVAAVRTRRTIVFYVRDPGLGFAPGQVPHAAVSNPPDHPLAHVDRRAELGLRPGGFGLLLARQVVDELLYSSRGNEVLMIKHMA